MAAIATLKAVLGMDSRPFRAGAQSATGATNKLQSSLASAGRTMATAFTVTAIYSAARALTRMGSTITDLASQSGLTTDAFQGLEHAAIKAGIAPEIFRTSLNKLAVTLGQAKSGMKTYIDLYERVGITAEEIERMRPDEVFERIAKTMAESERGSSEFGAALELVGTRSGGKLIEVMERINEIGLKGLIEDARNAGTLIEEETLRQLDELEDRLQVAKKQAATSAGYVAGGLMDLSAKAGRASDESKTDPGGSNPLKSIFNLFYKARFLGRMFSGVEESGLIKPKKPKRNQPTTTDDDATTVPDAAPLEAVKKAAATKKALEAAIEGVRQRGAQRIADIQGREVKVNAQGQNPDSLARIGGFIGTSRAGLGAADRQLKLAEAGNRQRDDIKRELSQMNQAIQKLESKVSGGAV